ncbi:amino acid ABC transporter permease [Mesorhizobium sp. M1076]|uniref:amino acid ABC transporter permease n=1 Tax=Mesorhizobium sp. M1076 TaxID=2957054 RepID=UPI00333A498C
MDFLYADLTDLGRFASGFLNTLWMTVIAGVGSMILGTIVAILRISPVPAFNKLALYWTELFKNCPLTVVLFFLAFGFPEAGFNASYLTFGIAGLILYTSAYVSEAVRAGFEAIPKAQFEAAKALGLNFSTTMRHIAIAQALKGMLPPLTSVFTSMAKDTAIVGSFGVGGELFSLANQLTVSEGRPVVPVFIGIACSYYVLLLPASIISARLETRELKR